MIETAFLTGGFISKSQIMLVFFASNELTWIQHYALKAKMN